MKSLLSLLIFLFFVSALHADSSLRYEEMRVAKVDVIPEGLTPDITFNGSTVRAGLKTKTGNFFSQAEFDEDLKLLSDEYADVRPSFQVINQKLYITLRIWLKPTIHAVTFCGNEKITAKKLRKELGISPGIAFDREEFCTAFNKLKFLYIKKGYFEAVLDYDIIPIEGTNTVDVQINICEGRAGLIKKIEFCGITSVEKSEIAEMMVTKTHIPLMHLMTGRGKYHPEMIDHDQNIILNYLINRGYADATVEICLKDAPERDKVILVIAVEKGERYFIGNLRFKGHTIFSNEMICRQLQVGKGSVYSPEKLRATMNAIRDLYGTCGYIEAAIDYQLSLREGCPVYDILITIDEGEQYKVGMVRVFGNSCTQTKVILNESLLCPGEVFDSRKLEGTEKRLCNTGFFSNANVYAVKSESGTNYRDVYMEVDETDTGNVGLFMGFSSLDRLFGGVELTERNFNILGATRILDRGPGALRGAGEYAHIKLNIGDRQTTYMAQWTKPYFLDTPWIVGVDAEKTNNRAVSRNYEIKTYGGNVHATYICNEYLKYDIHYRGRHTNNSVRDESNTYLAQQTGISGFVSAAGTSFIYDSTDHPRCPTSGFRSRLMYELAGLGGNFKFMKFAYLNTLYYPVSKKGVFKFRADLQFIHTYGDDTATKLPLSERLFLGGETTVRGYRPFIIGPKFGPNEPAGGVSSYLLSQEYQHNILKCPRLDGFVFVDAGYVSLSEFAIGRQAASAGFGIRVEVMRNVPLTLGMGYPIHPGEDRNNNVHFNNAQRFFFSVGAGF